MKKITLCASVSFYRDVVQLKNQLAAAGFTVFIPELATLMEQQDDYNFQSYREQFDDSDPLRKKRLIDAHFARIAEGDAVLVVNLSKHGVQGYVGPNVLMELTVGYYLGKSLFLWSSPARELPAYGEVMALQPKILEGEIGKIEEYFAHEKIV